MPTIYVLFMIVVGPTGMTTIQQPFASMAACHEASTILTNQIGNVFNNGRYGTIVNTCEEMANPNYAGGNNNSNNNPLP